MTEVSELDEAGRWWVENYVGGSDDFRWAVSDWLRENPAPAGYLRTAEWVYENRDEIRERLENREGDR